MNRFFKVLMIVLLTCSFLYQAKSQYFENAPQQKSFLDKLYFGGGLGLSFGQVTYIDFSPQVGYKLTKRFHPGISATYSYCNDKRYKPAIDYSTYGGSVFFRFFLFDEVFAQAEAEALNIEVFKATSSTTYDSYRRWIQNYLVGGGYFQKFGERSGMYILVLWNLNQTEFTPYENPVIKIGFNF